MQANPPLPVQLAFLAAATCFLAGCPGPYQWRHDHPLQEQAVAMAAISGRTVTLADGRSFDIAGVSLDGLSPTQVTEFEAALRNTLASCPWPPGSPGSLVLPTRARIVPFGASDGRAVALVITDLYPSKLPHLGCMGYPGVGFPFTPLVEHEYPISFDMGQRLLAAGHAHPAPAELPPNVTMARMLPARFYRRAEALAEEYVAAANDARAKNLNVHYTDERALKLAALASDRVAAKKLLDSGVDADAVSDGETALIALVSRSYRLEMATWVMEHGADPDRVVNGASAMSAAIGERSPWKIKALLDHGANPNAVVGERSLLAMARDGGPDFVELLLDHGAKPRDASEAAALMVRLAFSGWPRGIGMLLDLGFDPNQPTSQGALPLHAAVGGGKVEVVKLLLERGADPDLVEPGRPRTAIDIARERGDPKERVALLRLLNAARQSRPRK